MNRNEFLMSVIKFFHRRPCEDAKSAQNAIITLYDYIRDRAYKALEHKPQSLPWCECMFQVQQAMTWTPLRIFTRLLVDDELMPIRAAAKGNICDDTAMAEYADDPEVGLMSMANLPLMMSGRTTELQEEMSRDERLIRAVQAWTTSTHGMKFTPDLVVRVLTAEDLKDQEDTQ